MSERGAVAAVRRSAAQLESTPIQVKAGTTELTANPSQFGLHVNARASVRAARQVGRSHNPIDQLSGTMLRRLRDDTIPFVLHIDRERFDAVVDSWVTQTGKGLVDGGLRFEGVRVIEVAPKSGTGIQRAEARRQVLAALGRGESDAGTVPIGPTTPAVDTAAVRRVARQARAVLAAPVTVTVGMTPLVLSPLQVASTLSADVVDSRLVLRSDAAKLRAQYGPVLAFLEVPPKDASFSTNGTAVSIVPAVVGKLVNLEAVGREIAGGNHSFAAEVVDTQPARTTEWAQKLNITELVGSFTTSFPSGQPRVKNIQKASSVINGTILMPGETFSLNNALGPRTLDKGYVTAPGIGPDLAFEDAVGGGVSQVSTTLYNAAFFGCYQDVTHSVHALYISRYPMGREATLNYPSIDNRFRNDSNSGVLIRSFAGSSSITVALYGNKGGRTCRADGPHILETIPSAPEYVDDPALPTGTLKTLESGHTGYVVENFRIISVPGQPDKRERYHERYSSTPTKIARGTGAVPPPPAPPATPPATG
jgi:vancomycin resistance protein YoaR